MKHSLSNNFPYLILHLGTIVLVSDVSVLLEEWLDELDVHSVVLVGVCLESRCLEHLVSGATIVQELSVLLVVVLEAWDMAALPSHVSKVDRSI